MSLSVVLSAIVLLLILFLFAFYTYQSFIRDTVLSAPASDKFERINKILLSNGFAYSPDGDYFFMLPDCRQRDYGYCRFYDDTASDDGMIIDCESIYFSYGGRRWLLELRKGQYGLSAGAEAGIFAASAEDVHIPDVLDGPLFESLPDKELLPIDLCIYRKGQLAARRKEKHWRLAIFLPGVFCKPQDLAVKATITFPNREMQKACLEGIKSAGYPDCQILKVRQTVTILFSAPRTPQPLQRDSLVSKVVLYHNRLMCGEYQALTARYPETIDKLDCLRTLNPHLYHLALRFSGPAEAYERSPELLSCIRDLKKE